jgi:orotate phosphoribosyltransferase
MPEVERLAELLVAKLAAEGRREFTTVFSPAMGGLVIGQEVARRCRTRFIFAEKENDRLVLRRGFTFAPGERVLVVEDVVTRGGRVQECLDIAAKAGANVTGVAVLVDLERAGPAYKLAELWDGVSSTRKRSSVSITQRKIHPAGAPGRLSHPHYARPGIRPV